MFTASGLQRLLVLTAPDGPVDARGLDSLKAFYQLTIARTVDEALSLLRDQRFDAVLTPTNDFLPLERAIASQQGALILDTIGEGICISDQHGQILWSNKRMRGWPEPVQQRVQHACAEAYAIFNHQAGPMTADAAVPHVAKSKKFSINIADTQYFELYCSPVIDAQRRVTQVVAICWDATSGRRLQQKIDAIDQAGRELVKLEGEAIAKLNVGQRLKLLEEKIIKFCRQLMHFDHFAIRLLDRRTNKLELVISVGMPTEAMEVELFAEPDNNGISGYVAATGRSYICSDVMNDPRYVVGLAHAASSLTVPLMLHDRVVGIFNIESQTPNNFTEDDRQFAEIFGRYVALALNILNLLAVERYTTTGRLASDVSAEIAGPLNDIITEALFLQDEYIGNEDQRRRLQAIIDNVKQIRQSIKDVATGPATIIGASSLSKTTDPVLENRRILVADDEPNIRQTIADLLTRLGCNVDQAKDGAEAVAFLASQPTYDLVLSDIKMPHKNGYEIFAAAQKLGHKPPVILMTGFGYDPAHSIVRASSEGLAAVLFKPFKVDQLISEIKNAVSPR